MLGATSLRPDAVIGNVPPGCAPCTVEKAAINAVMAGCRPEYLPVLLTALEAALDPMFTLHGLLCSTCFSAPILVVNGPVARRLGLNSGVNALGQGNRANATIGRALNLIVRNVGDGKPGAIDRCTLGTPAKVTLCFAEDESDPAWMPLAQARGVPAGRSAVTLFQGDALQAFVDRESRSPEALARSLASALLAVGHPKLCEFCNALLVLSPTHWAVFRRAGWGRREVESALRAALLRPQADVVFGAHGVGEGIAPRPGGAPVHKFHDGGLLVARAGGEDGPCSAILGGWTGGRFRDESQPVTREIADA